MTTCLYRQMYRYKTEKKRNDIEEGRCSRLPSLCFFDTQIRPDSVAHSAFLCRRLKRTSSEVIIKTCFDTVSLVLLLCSLLTSMKKAPSVFSVKISGNRSFCSIEVLFHWGKRHSLPTRVGCVFIMATICQLVVI